MVTGTVVHSCILEPDKFSNDYSRDKSSKKNYMSAADYTMAMTLKFKLMSTLSARYFNEGVAEKEFDWEYFTCNGFLSCKSKIDYWINPCDEFPNGCIVDLKTTSSLSKVQHAINVYHYMVSAAFYSMCVMQELNLVNVPSFVFVFASKCSKDIKSDSCIKDIVIEYEQLLNEISNIEAKLENLKYRINNNDWSE
jgi:hypothetical protein